MTGQSSAMVVYFHFLGQSIAHNLGGNLHISWREIVRS